MGSSCGLCRSIWGARSHRQVPEMKRGAADPAAPLRTKAFARFRSMHDLEQAGRAHAAADAHGDDDVLGLAPAALDQGVAGAARAGHAERMADRDRAAVDVQLLV